MNFLISWFNKFRGTTVEKNLDDYKKEWKQQEETLTRIIIDITSDYTEEMSKLHDIIEEKDKRISDLEDLNRILEKELLPKT